ncbi:MAG: hypothetical protein GY760_25705 [Deltaproteobacteria bacterium]|nr:hypothetical protein [Deltaproteobacteria bacterium]
MGLDIYHYKLKKEPQKYKNYIICKELDLCIDADKFNYKEYISETKVREYISLIAIFNTKEELQRAKDKLGLNDGLSDYKLKLVGTYDSCEQAIVEFEKNNNLSGFEKSIYGDNININDSDIGFIDIAYDGIVQNVYHCEEVGYQRKGMTREFYEYFNNDFYYADKESFEKLLEFSDPQGNMYNLKNIKENFINNYEENKSVFVTSW